MRYIALLLPALVAACATPTTVWHHPSKPTASYQQDVLECDYQAKVATANIRSGVEAGYMQSTLSRDCMAARGYIRVRAQ